MNAFWEKIEEGLAGEFNVRALAPALAFWGTGIFLWGWSKGWEDITAYLKDLEATQSITIAVVLLILLELTNWFSDWLKLPLLQFMEGYWKGPLRWLRKSLTDNLDKKLEKKRVRLAVLAAKEAMTEEEEKEYKKLEAEDESYPQNKQFLLPTKLGNLLRVSELYSNRVYGLEILTVFPRLWLVLPEGVQTEISEARLYLDNMVKMVMLGIGLFIWSFINPWIIPVGVLIIVWGYFRAAQAAETYGLMLRAAFDLYRFDLFKQLHLTPPESPVDEIAFGTKVTQALARGLKDSTISFKHPSK
jgi:hypothetical protein